MYICPQCYKPTREKVNICSRCGFDTKAHDNGVSKTPRRENDTEISEVERLYEIIRELQQKGKQAVASRDIWKKRAEIAEEKLNVQTEYSDKKFRQVKMIFSKMYHPDSLVGDRFETLIKQEIFKEFWQVIEGIEKGEK